MVPKWVVVAFLGVLWLWITPVDALSHGEPKKGSVSKVRGSGHSHQHGVGQLQVASHGGQVEGTLVLPMADLAGFEGCPRSDRHRKSVGQLKESLLKKDNWLVLNREDCEIHRFEYESSSLRESDPKACEGSHSDLTLQFLVKCSVSGGTVTLDFPLLKSFTKIRRLNTLVVSPEGQASSALGPKNTGLDVPL